MAAQKFKLEGTDSALELDFEKISYESTNVTRAQRKRSMFRTNFSIAILIKVYSNAVLKSRFLHFL